MIENILLAGSAGFLGSGLFLVLFRWTIFSRLFTLECDVADLQERQLRSVRQSAANKRWAGEDQLDMQLDEALTGAAQPKKKGWTKWGSTSASSSERQSNPSSSESPQ